VSGGFDHKPFDREERVSIEHEKNHSEGPRAFESPLAMPVHSSDTNHSVSVMPQRNEREESFQEHRSPFDMHEQRGENPFGPPPMEEAEQKERVGAGEK